MHTYTIHHRIATLAELHEPFDYEGYKFSSYDPEPWKGDAWVATKEIKAENAALSINQFITELIPLLGYFSTVSQCSFRLAANTFIAYRKCHNTKKRLFVHFVRDTGAVGLHFDKPEIEQLKKVNVIPHRDGFAFMNEAANASTFLGRLTMLIMAIEGFSGETLVGKNYFTDPVARRAILGNNLDDRLYKKNVGLRNKLFHGVNKNQSLYSGLVDEIYDKLVDYLGGFGIDINKNVVNPQRNTHDNYEFARMFYGYKGTPMFDLKVIQEAIDERIKSRIKEDDLFVYLGNPKKPY